MFCKFTGMKVLGNSGDRPSKVLCDDLRARPDGLDHLTGGTLGGRSDEWSSGEIGHDSDLAGDWTTDDDT